MVLAMSDFEEVSLGDVGFREVPKPVKKVAEGELTNKNLPPPDKNLPNLDIGLPNPNLGLETPKRARAKRDATKVLCSHVDWKKYPPLSALFFKMGSFKGQLNAIYMKREGGPKENLAAVDAYRRAFAAGDIVVPEKISKRDKSKLDELGILNY